MPRRLYDQVAVKTGFIATARSSPNRRWTNAIGVPSWTRIRASSMRHRHAWARHIHQTFGCTGVVKMYWSTAQQTCELRPVRTLESTTHQVDVASHLRSLYPRTVKVRSGASW
jgi:hypothetical protein